MEASVRRRRVAHSCFLMSRQRTRTLGHRARYLAVSMLNSDGKDAFAYFRSSAPRLLVDALPNTRLFSAS
jgi:hypothetical protein